MSLKGFVSSNIDFLCRKAHDGCKLRFVLMDPDLDAVNFACGFSEPNPRYRKVEIGNTTRDLMPALATGYAELRYAPVVLPFTLIMSDSDQDNGGVSVEMYVLADAQKSPHVVLTQGSDNDKLWYEFFRNQFEEFWKISRPYRREESSSIVTQRPA
jgi:hypothetical protein